MAPTRVHHINFVVHDLEKAMREFERTLSVDAFEVVEHRPRGSRVARTQVGECWLVLVCPYDPDSIPGQYLARHGEGFFLISFGYGDVVKQLEQLESRGVQVDDRELRNGILDWHIADIGEVNGVLLQLTDDSAGRPSIGDGSTVVCDRPDT